MGAFHVRIHSDIDGLESRVELCGCIDERAGWSHWGVVPPSAAVRVDCREVDGLTAAGVRAWLRFFGALRARGLRLSFENVPPIILDILSSVPEMILDNEVRPADIPIWHKESPLKT